MVTVGDGTRRPPKAPPQLHSHSPLLRGSERDTFDFILPLSQAREWEVCGYNLALSMDGEYFSCKRVFINEYIM